jgi:hypothetical protein
MGEEVAEEVGQVGGARDEPRGAMVFVSSAYASAQGLLTYPAPNPSDAVP